MAHCSTLVKRQSDNQNALACMIMLVLKDAARHPALWLQGQSGLLAASGHATGLPEEGKAWELGMVLACLSVNAAAYWTVLLPSDAPNHFRAALDN